MCLSILILNCILHEWLQWKLCIYGFGEASFIIISSEAYFFLCDMYQKIYYFIVHFFVVAVSWVFYFFMVFPSYIFLNIGNLRHIDVWVWNVIFFVWCYNMSWIYSCKPNYLSWNCDVVRWWFSNLSTYFLNCTALKWRAFIKACWFHNHHARERLPPAHPFA